MIEEPFKDFVEYREWELERNPDFTPAKLRRNWRELLKQVWRLNLSIIPDDLAKEMLDSYLRD